MKRLIKYFMVIAIIFTIIPCNVFAKDEELSYFELIEIADPYVDKNDIFYKIKCKNELRNILGDYYYSLIEERVNDANAEIRKSMNRDAFNAEIIAIFKANGNTVEEFWWGKKIKTYGYTNSKNTRNIMYAFATAENDKTIQAALVAAGISFIPGYGAVGTIFGLATGAILWANAKTWTKAYEGIEKKMQSGVYYITIDINSWNMDVRVYNS